LAGEFFIDRETDPNDDHKLMQRWVHDLAQNDPHLRQIVVMEVEAKLRRYGLAMCQQKPSVQEYSAPSSHGSPIERITQFIARHYQSKLVADDIAADAGLHPKYLMQMFKRNCGMSLWDYVQHTRVSHAQRLLLMSDIKLIDIAMDAGFGSVGRFYATFRKICGMTPRDYRMQKMRP